MHQEVICAERAPAHLCDSYGVAARRPKFRGMFDMTFDLGAALAAKAPVPVVEPEKWYNVYAYGTKAGDEEAKVFRALSRGGNQSWRSTAAVAKETGLTAARVEEIIDKYASCKPPLIYASPLNEGHWCYWEREPAVLIRDTRDLSQKDKDARVDKQIAGADVVVAAPASAAHAAMTVTTTVTGSSVSPLGMPPYVLHALGV